MLYLILLAATLPVEQIHLKKASYEIQGVFCSGCIGKLITVTKQLDGVKDVRVEIEKRLVSISFDEKKVSAEKI